MNLIFDNYSATNLSYFELNLETWRQLWRVVEMSDVILLITDIRHPVSSRCMIADYTDFVTDDYIC